MNKSEVDKQLKSIIKNAGLIVNELKNTHHSIEEIHKKERLLYDLIFELDAMDTQFIETNPYIDKTKTFINKTIETMKHNEQRQYI